MLVERSIGCATFSYVRSTNSKVSVGFLVGSVRFLLCFVLLKVIM